MLIIFYCRVGGGNDELKADGGISIKLLKLAEHGFIVSNI
jgi:hypothetical protein